MKCSEFKNINVVIATHVFATGPSQELEEYLQRKVKTLMFIGHPFSYAQEVHSFFEKYAQGKLCKKGFGRIWALPEPLMYLKDFGYTFFWIVKSKERFELFVGVDPLNALAGVLLNKLGRVRTVIMYTIDYVPQRFNNRLLNRFYHQIDSYCVKKCHKIWNLSPMMAKEREKKGVTTNEKQIVVPIGVNLGIKRLPVNEVNRNCVAYMGHLREGQGLELIIRALPKVTKKIPNIKLLIIGTGRLETPLKNLAKELGVNKNVEFTGFIKDPRVAESILVKCGVGLALYEPTSNSITQYTDPSKPKQYMACGLPVIITRVPWIAQEIEQKALGIVVNYNEEECSDAIVKILTDEKLYNMYRQNAINFVSNLDWTKIFNEAFSKS